MWWFIGSVIVFLVCLFLVGFFNKQLKTEGMFKEDTIGGLILTIVLVSLLWPVVLFGGSAFGIGYMAYKTGEKLSKIERKKDVKKSV